MEWLKANTWLAEWVGTAVAVMALVGPPVARFFKVKVDQESITRMKNESKLIGELLSFALSRFGLALALIIELIGLIFSLWTRATFGCLALYSSAITVLILSLLSRLTQTATRGLEARIGG